MITLVLASAEYDEAVTIRDRDAFEHALILKAPFGKLKIEPALERKLILDSNHFMSIFRLRP